MLKLHVTAAYTHDGGVASVTHTADIDVSADDPGEVIGDAVTEALRTVKQHTDNLVPYTSITVVLTFGEA